MDKEEFKPSDKVITSKGRFGIIESVSDKYAHVRMGNKVYEIYQAELLHVLSARGIEIEYYKDFINTYDSPLKEIIYVSKHIVLYDFNNPINDVVLNECKLKLIKRIDYKNVIITKLILI